jgi:hypothetical protein
VAIVKEEEGKLEEWENDWIAQNQSERWPRGCLQVNVDSRLVADAVAAKCVLRGRAADIMKETGLLAWRAKPWPLTLAPIQWSRRHRNDLADMLAGRGRQGSDLCICHLQWLAAQGREKVLMRTWSDASKGRQGWGIGWVVAACSEEERPKVVLWACTGREWRSEEEREFTSVVELEARAALNAWSCVAALGSGELVEIDSGRRDREEVTAACREWIASREDWPAGDRVRLHPEASGVQRGHCARPERSVGCLS